MDRERNTTRVLAVLAILSSVIGLCIAVAFPEAIQSYADAYQQVHSLPYILNVCPFFLSFSVVTGAGLWAGRPWGWWLAIFYFLLRALGGLIGTLGSLTPVPSAFVLLIYGWRLFFGVAMVIYLYRENSREYFGVSHRASTSPLMFLFLVAVACSVVLCELFSLLSPL